MVAPLVVMPDTADLQEAAKVDTEEPLLVARAKVDTAETLAELRPEAMVDRLAEAKADTVDRKAAAREAPVEPEAMVARRPKLDMVEAPVAQPRATVDRVAELPRLLRTAATKEVRRLADTEARAVDTQMTHPSSQ